jgi:hypothetical protein
MNVGEGIFISWSELAMQDLLIDVAAAVDATESDRVWGPSGPSGPTVVSPGNLRLGGRYGQRRE